MSTVISVRVPRRIREELERLGIDYSQAIRQFLEELVEREKARQIAEEMDRIRARTRSSGNLAARFIREDRDAG